MQSFERYKASLKRVKSWESENLVWAQIHLLPDDSDNKGTKSVRSLAVSLMQQFKEMGDPVVTYSLAIQPIAKASIDDSLGWEDGIVVSFAFKNDPDNAYDSEELRDAASDVFYDSASYQGLSYAFDDAAYAV